MIYKCLDLLNQLNNLLRNTRVIRSLYYSFKFFLFLLKLRVFKLRRKDLRLIIGSSSTTQAGWISSESLWLDILQPTDWQKYFEVNTVDALLAEHVFEHIEPELLVHALDQIFLYLRPGGYIRIAVPDGNHPDDSYIREVKPGGTGPGATDHKVLYDFKTLSEMFVSAGFTVDLLEYFDSEHIFHRKNWDVSDGYVARSLKFDQRNLNATPNYSSIILDATKPTVG